MQKEETRKEGVEKRGQVWALSTETHDKMIKEAVRWAKSLGYEVVEHHLGTETGADAIFQNHFNERVILEVVTGVSFKSLFKKPRINEVFRTTRYWIPPETLGLIVVGDRIDNVKRHGIEAGLPAKLFDPLEQRIFPVLLVSLLGARASPKEELAQVSFRKKRGGFGLSLAHMGFNFF